MTDPKTITAEKIYVELEHICRLAISIKDSQAERIFPKIPWPAFRCIAPEHTPPPPKQVHEELLKLQKSVGGVTKEYLDCYGPFE